MRARGTMLGAPRPLLPHPQYPLASPARVGELAILLDQLSRRPAPVETPQQDRRRRFHDARRRVAQHVRKTHVRNVFAQADGVRQIRVGMIFDDEVRRAPFASKAGVDTMKYPFTAGNRAPGALRELLQEGFLRTGPGVACFSASSISESASFVPSIASSSVSR